MTPCEQKDTIKDIWESIDPLKVATARMEAAISRMVEEFTLLSRDLRENILNERELKTRLEQNTKDINEIYVIIRAEQTLRQRELVEQKDGLEKKLAPLLDFKSKLEGSLAVSKAVPILASAVALLVALIGLFK